MLICRHMNLLQRLFAPKHDPRAAWRPLYQAVVAHGRDPLWYHAGAPDTLDGRFDMIAAVLSHLLIRLEGDASHEAPVASAMLTELFVADMDGQLRQIGIGDLVVGKHIGRMMSALGGRMGAYRAAAGHADALAAPLVRNLWRGEDPGEAKVAAVAALLARFAYDLGETPTEVLLAGQLPPIAVAA